MINESAQKVSIDSLLKVVLLPDSDEESVSLPVSDEESVIEFSTKSSSIGLSESLVHVTKKTRKSININFLNIIVI